MDRDKYISWLGKGAVLFDENERQKFGLAKRQLRSHTPLRKPLDYVDVEWKIRTKGTWTIYETHVREDIAARLVKTFDSTDRLFTYRIKPKENTK